MTSGCSRCLAWVAVAGYTCKVLAAGGSGTNFRGLSVAAVSDGAPRPPLARRRKLVVPRLSRGSDVRRAGVCRGSSLQHAEVPTVSPMYARPIAMRRCLAELPKPDLSSLVCRCRPQRSWALTQPSTAEPAMIAPLAKGDAIEAWPFVYAQRGTELLQHRARSSHYRGSNFQLSAADSDSHTVDRH